MSEAAATYTLDAGRQQDELCRRLSRLAWRAMVLTREVRDTSPAEASARAAEALDEITGIVAQLRAQLAHAHREVCRNP